VGLTERREEREISEEGSEDEVAARWVGADVSTRGSWSSVARDEIRALSTVLYFNPRRRREIDEAYTCM